MITFKPIEKSDLQILKEWRNSDSVRNYVREYRLLNDSDQEAWYNSYLASRRKADFDQEIGILNNVAVGGFTRIEWRNQRAELTFYSIDQTDEEIKIYITFLLDKGFREFNFHKITWPVYGHDPHLELYKTIFNAEAVLREEYYWNGVFQDRIYLSLLKKDFFMLDK